MKTQMTERSYKRHLFCIWITRIFTAIAAAVGGF